MPKLRESFFDSKGKTYKRMLKKYKLKSNHRKIKNVIIKALFSSKTPAFLLSLMSIIISVVISVVGVRLDSRSNRISQKQFEILENDREAYFTVDVKGWFEKFNDVYDYEEIYAYTVYNQGGIISGAYLVPVSYLKIFINDSCYGDKIYKLPIIGRSYIDEGIFEFYNEEDKSFKFYIRESSKLDEFIKNLDETIEEQLSNGSVMIFIEDKITITYINYQNIKKEIKYDVIYKALSVDDSTSKVEVLPYIAENCDDIELKEATEVVLEKYINFTD